MERADALAETNFVLQDRFLFPSEPRRGPREPKFDLSEHYPVLLERYSVLSEQYPDLLERYVDPTDQYADLPERPLLMTEGGTPVSRLLRRPGTSGGSRLSIIRPPSVARSSSASSNASRNIAGRSRAMDDIVLARLPSRATRHSSAYICVICG